MIGIPILILLIAGGVLGGIFGSRAAKNSTKLGGSAVGDTATVSAANANAAAGGADKLFYSATDVYGNPVFLDNVNTAPAATSDNKAVTCNDDQNNLSFQNPRPHPRVMAPGYLWNCMKDRISKDAYLTIMDKSVMQNATAFYNMPVTNYAVDGGFSGSGILDVAREIQLRVRSWAYAYRMTKDQKWLQRTWLELQTAAGNTSTDFGQYDPQTKQLLPMDTTTGRWNPTHFLDLAEMTAAFAVGFDWMYDGWNATQKTYIADWILTLGLNQGYKSYFDTTANGAHDLYGWWQQPSNGNGNWNCVCNSGLILGALAIVGEPGLQDTNHTVQKLYNAATANIKANCFQGPYADGTWAEVANYWYFGTNAAARAHSAIYTATGDETDINPNFYQTGYYHMYVSGNGGMFNYGDHGPNKFATNANALLWWGSHYKQQLLTLFQRDRADALGDPLALVWYDTAAKGAFWNGLPLDKHFDDPRGNWVSMRSSWTDFNGVYVAMKSSNLTGHQTHGDLDVGDFVLDALGTRWAGEFGSAQYLSKEYFSNETQGSTRWDYFRKGTQGQNTIVIDEHNQLVTYSPSQNDKFGTASNAIQSADINYKPGTNDIAFFTTDMSSAYQGASAGQVVRGVRLLNGRRQVLLQDEIAAGVAKESIEWRVQTNATVSISGNTATLTINKVVDPNAAIGLTANIPTKTLKVQILSPSGATFTSNSADQRLSGTDPDPSGIDGLPGDPSNAGVTTLVIKLPPGEAKIQTLWQPQWDDLSSADNATPKDVPLSSWSLTSHS